MTYRPTTATIILIILVCLYAVGFGLLAARAYSAHESGALDLGNYDQALWNAAQGRGLRLTLLPQLGPTRFALHVEPILFLIVPLYRFVADDPRLLLWLQAVVIALGGLPLHGLARRRLGSDWAALAIVAAYYLLPAVESVTLFDFHAVGLAPTLLLAALYFLDRALITTGDPRGLWTGPVQSPISNPQSPIPPGLPASPSWPGQGAGNLQSPISPWVWSGLFFLLALGTKEDISLNVLMIGLYLLALRRRWRPGLALIAVGLAWFYIAFYIVIPASRPSGAGSAYTGFFAALGGTPLEIALSPIRTPGKVVALLATLDNIRALKMLTLPLAFMPLAGLPLLILTAPTLAITLLSSNPLMHQLETYHYAAPAIPFVMLAAVDGIARLSNLKMTNKRMPALRAGASVREAANQPISNLQSLITCNLLSIVVLVASLTYHYYRGYSPLARPFHWPDVTAHERIGDELAASIPPEVPVVAQAELVPLVSHRPWIQIWQGPFDERADYFLLDVSHPAFVNRDGAQESLLSDIAQDPTVGLIASNDGYLLLQRDAPRLPTTPEFFTFAYADPPASATPVAATFGDGLQLVAFETHRNYADREAEPLITLYWQVLAPSAEDYFIAIFLLDESGEPAGATPYQQPLTVWLPTSRWEPGRTVRLLANTFPWWTGDRRRFGYGIGVVRGDQPWEVSTRLPVIRDDGGPAPLNGATLLPLARFERAAGIPYEVEAKAARPGSRQRAGEVKVEDGR
ncbi:MAG: DUF2079 domain-containing protein [Anaerolineae bacterium]|jgi:uncharacterized membrane protein